MDWVSLWEHAQDHLDRGGILMLAIAVLSVWMWALIGLKWHMLRSVRRNECQLRDCLEQLQSSGTADGLSQWQLQLIQAGIHARRLGKTLRRRYMAAQAEVVAAEFTRHTSTILMLAGAAPLLGLLGTVTGMIETFDVITLHGTGNAKGLASGISIALITTQAGLVAAVPGLLLGNFLRRRSQQACERVDRFTHGLLLEAERGGLAGLASSQSCQPLAE